MLRDRLNICEEAVDYFRASSALLKAGIAAGLTLYDIAIMCCRNDDLGEIPSMMEKLFDVAADLATVAVANERWHHTTASQALENKLSSFRRPATEVSACSGNKKFMRKSFSNVEFVAFTSNELSVNLSNQVDESPALIQSNGSDSSSETDDDEAVEDCEKWAEQVIADVSLEKIGPLGRPFRSGSVSSSSSDDGDSVECRGFWRVAPGQIKTDAVPDDSSGSWSIDFSPLNAEIKDKLETTEAERTEEKLSTPKMVTFAKFPERNLVPPSTVNVTEFKSSSMLRNDNGTMVRSRSYSGLVDKDRGTRSESRMPYNFNLRKSENAYKKYFHKFIDLVIVRETSAALRNQRTPLMF